MTIINFTTTILLGFGDKLAHGNDHLSHPGDNINPPPPPGHDNDGEVGEPLYIQGRQGLPQQAPMTLPAAPTSLAH